MKNISAAITLAALTVSVGVQGQITLTPMLQTRDGSSANWSGYASGGKPRSKAVTAVYGSWIVPSVSQSALPTYCASWVGMDGFNGQTVEQIGIESDWTVLPDGSWGEESYAWWEMYPGYSYFIAGFDVKAGDAIGAGVVYVGNDAFTLSITNYTSGVFFSTTQSLPGAKRNSAEWIVEAPFGTGLLPLADFDTITFNDCCAVVNSIMTPIDGPGLATTAITMGGPANYVKAQPSALVDSATTSSFSVQWFGN